MFTVIFENELNQLQNVNIANLQDVQIVMFDNARNLMKKFFKSIIKADKDNREFYDCEDIYFSIRKCYNSYPIYFGDDAECEIHGGDISEQTFYNMLQYLKELRSVK